MEENPLYTSNEEDKTLVSKRNEKCVTPTQKYF